MVDNTINKGLDTTITHHLRQLPYPLKGVITKVYSDESHVNVKTDSGMLEYVETVGGVPIKNHTCVLLFLDGNSSSYIVIC